MSDEIKWVMLERFERSALGGAELQKRRHSLLS